MRRGLLLVAALGLLLGCEHRTVSPEEAKALREEQANARGRDSSSQWTSPDYQSTSNQSSYVDDTIIETPIYDSPIDVVQAAVVRVCRERYGDDIVSDHEKHTIIVKSSTVWAGSSTITATLSTNAKKQTVVNLVSSSGDSASRTVRDIREITRRLSVEMERVAAAPAPLSAADRLQQLDDLRAKQLVTDDEYQEKRKAILKDL